MIYRRDRRLLGAVLAGLALCAPAGAEPGGEAIVEGQAALARADGVAAEIAGRRALAEGASRAQVAALIGEGELLQGDLADAREWLGPGVFAPASRERGLHALARLEMEQNQLDAAQAAFDRLLQQGPGDAALWVDLGRLRYRLGDHHGAVEAAREAMRLGPDEPRAVEFMAQIVRDSQGLASAVPLFRQAAGAAPKDVKLLGQYAATLGDAGHHGQMLKAARRMVELDGRDPQAYYLQALLAARAGKDDLARRLLWRTAGAYDETPAGMMLIGTIEYRTGNYALAVEQFANLQRLQPMNPTAALLFARALVANGDANVAARIVEPLAERGDAPAYLLVLLGRAWEQLGDRQRAALWLDRAARQSAPAASPMPAFAGGEAGSVLRPDGNTVLRLRGMFADGRAAEALREARALAAQFDGSVDYGLLAGDAELLAGSPEQALRHYRRAAQVRSNWPLIRRMVHAQQQLGDDAGARRVLAWHLARNPRDGNAARLLARLEGEAGRPGVAADLLLYASGLGSGARDPRLLADLARQQRRARALAHR